MMSSLRCETCGSSFEISEDSSKAFCPQCGSPLVNLQEQVVPIEVPESGNLLDSVVQNTPSTTSSPNLFPDAQAKQETPSKHFASSNNKKRIVIGGAIGVIAILVIAFALFGFSPSGKYDAGKRALNNGNWKEASSLFDQAGDYKDANLYKACADLAYNVFVGGSHEEAVALLSKVNDNFASAEDEDARNLAIFVAAEFALADGNHSGAIAAYATLPNNYEVAGYKARDGASIAAICGEWKLNSIYSPDEGLITYENLSSSYKDRLITVHSDHTWECEGIVGAYGSGKGNWVVDSSKTYITGPWYYVMDPSGSLESSASIQDGVFACGMSGGDIFYFVR